MFGWFKKKKKQKEVQKEVPQKVEVKEEVQLTEEESEPTVETVQEETVETKKEEPKRKRKAINHITKHKEGGWQIKKEGSSRALKRFSTQKEAIDYAKGLEDTTGTGYIIHKADGTTRKKTY